jgi:rubrerythrin
VSVAARVDSDAQLARLLQIGAVLDEVVEVRAHRHYQSLPETERDAAVEGLLEEAAEESAEHRERLEALAAELDAGEIPVEQVERIVGERYRAEDFDGVLYDQLHGEETAYKFYDDLIGAIEASEATFRVDRDRLLAVLREIREAEAEGVEEVAELMSER